MESQERPALDAEELFRHRDWAVNLARSLVGNHGEPEALAQDALTAAWARPPGTAVDLRAWLRTILHRKAISRRRENGHRSDRESLVARGEAAQENAGQITERADLHRRLVEHILALPQAYSVVLLQRYFDGWSPGAIAKYEGCALSTISNRLTQARQALRARLEREGEGSDWISAYGPLLMGPSIGLRAGLPMLALKLTWAVAAAAIVLAVAGWVFLREPNSGPNAPFGSELGPSPLSQADGDTVSDTDLLLELAEPTVVRETLDPAAPDVQIAETADDGLLHGRLLSLIGGHTVAMPGTATLVFAETSLASMEASAEDGVRPEFLFHSFTAIQDDLGIPVAMEGHEVAAVDGAWTMEPPDKDLVLVRVESSGDDWDIQGNRVLRAGARSMEVLARPFATGELRVLDEAGSPIMDGLQVRTSFALPTGRAFSILTIRTGPIGKGTVERPNHRIAPKPSDKATTLVDGTSSPIRLSSRDYERELWVGKDGYAWKRISWPAFETMGEIELTPVGSLDVEIVGWEEAKALYNLVLTRGNEHVVSWNGIRGDGRYTASGCNAGEHTLRLQREKNGHTSELRKDTVWIVPGDAAGIVIDLSTLDQEPKGSATFRIKPPKTEIVNTDFVQLRLDAHRANGGHSTHMLRNYALVDEHRIGQVPGLAEGRYTLTAFHLGIAATFDVIAGEDTLVELDLSQLAEVIPTFRSQTPSKPGAASNDASQVIWRYLNDQGEALSGFSNRALFVDGASSFACKPGPLLLRAEGPKQQVMGPPIRIEVTSGINHIEVPVTQDRRVSLELTLAGVPEQSADEWEIALHTALRFEQAGSPALLYRVTRRTRRQAFVTLRAHVDFLDPGLYPLVFEGDAAKQLEGLPAGPLMLVPDKPLRVELAYRGD